MLMSNTQLHIYALSTTFFALPQFLVLAALPSPLQSLLPGCAQSCLEDYLQQDFVTSICPDLADLGCLCSHYGSDGYTLGERAYACLYSNSCTQATRSNGTSVFSVCASRSNAVTPTHKTVIITATPSTITSSTSSIAGVEITAVTTSATQFTSSAAATTLNAGASFSTGPNGTKMSANISLTMAQIAGITIAAAALLILTVGIACCLIFVRKRNKRLEMEDQKVLIYENSPESQNYPQNLPAPRKAPRGRAGGDGIIPLHRYSQEQQPQEEQRTWPRYYPVAPDEQAIEAIVNQSLMFPPRPAVQSSYRPQSSNSNDSNRRSRQGINNCQSQQNTGIILPPPPLPPAQAHPRRSKPPPMRNPPNLQPHEDFSPTSAATDIEEDDPKLRPSSNFAGSRPMSGINFGEWPKPPVNPVPVVSSSPPRNKRALQPPPLTIDIPKVVQTLPLPPSQRPPLLRQDPIQQAQPQQRPFPPPPSQSQQSSYSSAIASSQALGAWTGYDTSSRQSSERSISNSRRPSKSSARSHSQASYTSFESMSSDDDPTPPKEEDKRLSPVHESPVSYIRYPKIPRASNQIVPRTPPSQWSRGSDVSSLRGSPNASGSPVVKQGIGNKLWKTEISPQGTRPQYATWGTKSTPPMSGPFSPGFGQMPKLTPTRRGGDLYLDISR